MTALVLNLAKPGDVAPKLQLNLKKGESFTVKLSWDGSTDIDLHAIVCTNNGGGAKVTALEDILSPYNIKRTIAGSSVGTLDKKSDGTFEIRAGAVKHSPDATDGAKEGDDEWIVIDPTRLVPNAGSVIEIPLVAMIHPQSSGAKFANVQNAKVSVVNADGASLMTASLSNQFGEFVGVQMGSIIIDGNGAPSFAQVGVGFNGDFNDVINNFA